MSKHRLIHTKRCTAACLPCGHLHFRKSKLYTHTNTCTLFKVHYRETVVVDFHVCVCLFMDLFVCMFSVEPIYLFGCCFFSGPVGCSEQAPKSIILKEQTLSPPLLSFPLLFSTPPQQHFMPTPPPLPHPSSLRFSVFSFCLFLSLLRLKQRQGQLRSQKQEGQEVTGAARQVRGKPSHEDLSLFFLLTFSSHFFVSFVFFSFFLSLFLLKQFSSLRSSLISRFPSFHLP